MRGACHPDPSRAGPRNWRPDGRRPWLSLPPGDDQRRLYDRPENSCSEASDLNTPLFFRDLGPIIDKWRTDVNRNIKKSRKSFVHVIILASAFRPFLLYWSFVLSTRPLDAISAQVARLLKEEREKR